MKTSPCDGGTPAARRAFLRTALLSIAPLAAPRAFAQNYPAKAVRVVIPSPPGSFADILPRLLSARMSEALGQPIVADNKPGASGALAAESIAKSPPDGYSLLFSHDGIMAMNPFVYSKLGYEPLKDFEPVSLVARASLVMVANPSLGAKNLNDVIRLARAKPKTINFGSGGNGHPTHLAVELLCNRLGVELVHVPFKGTAPAMQAAVSGDVSLIVTAFAEALPHVRSGRVIPIAASGPAAKETFPQVQDLGDLHPDLNLAPWVGYFAPRGTPQAAIAVLNQAIAKASTAPEVKARFAELGLTLFASSPEELNDAVVKDMAKYGPLIKRLGITAE